MGKENKTDFGDPRVFLSNFQFDLEGWQGKTEASRITSQFYLFVLALGQSRKRNLSLPAIESPIDFIHDHIDRIQAKWIKQPTTYSWRYNLQPEEELFVDSHLSIPYVFPSVLNVLASAQLLSADGLGNLALAALENKQAWIKDDLTRQIKERCPPGVFAHREQALEFIAYLADNLRESFGKTPITTECFGAISDWGILENIRDIFTTDNIAKQRAVLSDLQKYFNRERRSISPAQLDEYYRSGYIEEPPGDYLKRMARYDRYKKLICQGIVV